MARLHTLDHEFNDAIPTLGAGYGAWLAARESGAG